MHYCRSPVYAVVVGRTSRLSFLPSSGWFSATPDGFCSLGTDFRTFKTPSENLAPDPLSVSYKVKPSISVPHVCRTRSLGVKIWLWWLLRHGWLGISAISVSPLTTLRYPTLRKCYGMSTCIGVPQTYTDDWTRTKFHLCNATPYILDPLMISLKIY